MFLVEWHEAALNELAALWLAADAELRKVLAQAALLIDEQLSRNASSEGESRPAGQRITFVPPLAVRFQVEADGKTATVLHVRLYRARK